MDIFSKEIKNRSRQVARSLLAQAEKNEPRITFDLQEIASELSAEIIGINNRFKTVQSLTGKINKQSFVSIKILADSGFPLDDAIEKIMKREAARNNDALRYTFVFQIEKYVFGFKQTIEKLRQKNYAVPENRIWNAWKNIGTTFDKGYRAINVTIISSEKQIFELQFHTRESYELKIEIHPLYKLLQSGKISQKMRIEISEKIIRLAQKIMPPKGVKKL